MPHDDEPALGVRDLSDAEIAAYRENGWVQLPRLVAPWVVEEILRRVQSRMGVDPVTVTKYADHTPTSTWERWDSCSQEDEWLRKLTHSPAFARVAARLMDDDVRFYSDHVFAKLPASRHGSETPWHQDLPLHPLDRAGSLTIWIALVDCPPEKGTMRFLSGSHRAGMFGHYLNRDDGISLLDEHAWLADEYEISQPIHLPRGDATAHDMAIAHYAGENMTDSPRWAYLVQWLPQYVRYTGLPNRRTDGLGLEVGKPLDHPRFPLFKTALHG